MKGQLNEEAKDCITDAINFLGQAQSNLSIRRRYMIRPHLKKNIKPFVTLLSPVTSQFFGDGLNKEIKKSVTLRLQWA